jgi:hypothetical protein
MLTNTNRKQQVPGPISNPEVEITEFLFVDIEQIKATITRLDTETGDYSDEELTYGTDYEVMKYIPDGTLDSEINVLASTGTLTLKSHIVIDSENDTLTMYRDSALTQEKQYPRTGPFPAQTHEGALDYLTMQNQEQSEMISRCARVPITSIDFDGTLPFSNPGKALVINETGNGFILSDDNYIDQLENVTTQAGIATASANNASTSEINADASADRAEAAASSLESFVDIYPQLPLNNIGNITADFTLLTNKVTRGALTTSGRTITLPTTLEVGVENRVVLDFSSTVSAVPIFATSGIVCWSSINNNRKPTVLTTETTERNQFTFSTIDGGAHWNAEYKTFKERSADTVIYGYYIDTADSNPATRVHYIQDNASFVDPSYMNFTSDVFHYGDWQNAFFMPRPVMLRANGTVDYELNPNDLTKKKDGTASDIANTAYAGNAMIGWPTIYTKRYTDGNYQYVIKSNKQIDSSYKAWSWYNSSNNILPEVYTHLYQPAAVSNVLRSLSGQTIFANAAGTIEITYAQANGSAYGWYTGVWADWVELQELLVLMSKSTAIQAKFGQGRSSAANSVTGEGNLKGPFYGTSGNGLVKVFGIENPYGNYWKRLAGCVYTASGWKVKMTVGTADGSTVTSYNSDGTGYLIPGVSVSGTSGGYISGATMTTYGLLPNTLSGSSSTYLCDGCWYASGGYALVGGAYDNGAHDGAFALDSDIALSGASASLGSSLSCKPPS